MNLVEGVFLYLPFPYWAAFVLLQYKNDLSRLLHPERDEGSLRNWWSVLRSLGLLDAGTLRPSTKDEILPYAICILISTGLSLSWMLRIFPSLWYYLIVVQGISGIVLTAATMRYLGTPPRRPYVDVLRFPRLGSRVRHLPKMPPMKRGKNRKLPGPKEMKMVMTTAKRRSAAMFRSIRTRLRK
jgi:hypothetical protein